MRPTLHVFRDHHHAGLRGASAVAIGNFDGVHLGHQALLRRARELAAEVDPADLAKVPGVASEAVATAVVSFEPLPRAFFAPQAAPVRLTGPAEKLRLLRENGVDLAWLLRFNAALAGLSARAFVERILVRGLGARAVVIGEDFRFGRGREGDLATMQALGDEYGFVVSPVGAVMADGLRISSTAIREALARGELDRAATLLGRPYALTGHVVRGRQLGRKLGYPTANLRPWGGAAPVDGVFAVRARVLDADGAGGACGPWRDGVASVGVRPAVGGGEPLVEVHLFDFEGDLYGRRLETRFVKRLRGEEDFPDLDALVVQMNNDEREARAVLAHASAE
ncbi:MAG: bifunctional riboflavin kinase/FAD synthetase [Xanthomonadales bacterium]|jgi:riboflavin kinase/FMN adenylyltransferase|nr:bifunctional riboflavin kinase/FAD synthetase [Xanthomonadales bacterium]